MQKLSRLISIPKMTELLVCETDGFSLRGSVLSKADTHIDVLYQACIKEKDMGQAVAELINILEESGWRKGGPAILLTPAVLCTLVELPVNPKKPRPLSHMIRLVQDEIEALLIQHMTRWAVGNILVRQGYLSLDQAQTILDVQQGKPISTGELTLSEQYSFRRFGELALEYGYINQAQLQICLAYQDWLKTDDEIIECNWAPQGPVEDLPGSYRWLVSALGRSLLLRWVSEFKQQNIQLTTVYPQYTCSTSLLPQDLASKMLVESFPGRLYASQVDSNGYIRNLNSYIDDDNQTLVHCLESYQTMADTGVDSFWINGSHENTQSLVEQLRSELPIEVNILNDPSTNDVLTLSMLATARHNFGITHTNCCLGVRTKGPLPPLTERIEFRLTVLGSLLLAIILIAEMSLWLRYRQANQESHELTTRWSSIEQATKRINLEIDKIAKRKENLLQRQAEQEQLSVRINFFNNTVPERMKLILAVFSILQNTINENIVIHSLKETDHSIPHSSLQPNNHNTQYTNMLVGGFDFEAWAITEEAAQSYIQTLEQAFKDWDLEVRDIQVYRDIGPINLDGFAFKMRLLKGLSHSGNRNLKNSS